MNEPQISGSLQPQHKFDTLIGKKRNGVARNQCFICRGPNLEIRGYQAHAWLVLCAQHAAGNLLSWAAPEEEGWLPLLVGKRQKSWGKWCQHGTGAGVQARSWNCIREKGWSLDLKLRHWVQSRTETASTPVPQHHISALRNEVGWRLEIFASLCFSLSQEVE